MAISNEKLKYTKALKQMLDGKESVKKAIKNKGVNVPDDAPFRDYDSYVAQIGGGLNGGDNIVYWSWIDPVLGTPKSFRVSAYTGKRLHAPVGYGEKVLARKGVSPVLFVNPMYNPEDYEKKEVFEDEIRQTEYSLWNEEVGVDPNIYTPVFFAVRFKPTAQYYDGQFDFYIDAGNSFGTTITLRVLLDGEFQEDILLPNGGLNFSISVPDSLLKPVFFEKSHLFEMYCIKPDLPYIQTFFINRFILGGLNNIVDIPDGSQLYHDKSIGKREHTDKFYASQIEAIYIHSFRPEAVVNKFLYYPTIINIKKNALNALTGLTTFVCTGEIYNEEIGSIVSNIYPLDIPSTSRIFKNSASLEYMSALSFYDSSTISYPEPREDIYIDLFYGTGAKFLKIVAIPYIGNNFLQDAYNLEILPSEIITSYYNPINIYKNCINLRNLPDFPTDNLSIDIKTNLKILDAISFAENCQNITRLPNYIFKGIGNNFCYNCFKLAYVNYINDNIIAIGNYFMANCISLTEFNVNLTKLFAIGSNFLDSCINIKEISGIGFIENTEDYFCFNCSSLEKIEDMPYLVRIGNNFMAACSSLKETPHFKVALSNIGQNFFAGCVNLNVAWVNALILDLNNHNGEGAFTDCYSLDFIWVKDGERNKWISICPNIPTKIIVVDDSTISHLVLFRWLESNPEGDTIDYLDVDYKAFVLWMVPGLYWSKPIRTLLAYGKYRQFYHRSLITKEVFVRVIDGETCEYPEGFPTLETPNGRPTVINATVNNPFLWIHRISGDISQLKNGIKQDLVIQAEYQHHIGDATAERTDDAEHLLDNFGYNKNIYGGELSFFTLFLNSNLLINLNTPIIPGVTPPINRKIDSSFHFSVKIENTNELEPRKGYIYTTSFIGNNGNDYTTDYTHATSVYNKVDPNPYYFKFNDFIGYEFAADTSEEVLKKTFDNIQASAYGYEIYSGQTKSIIETGVTCPMTGCGGNGGHVGFIASVKHAYFDFEYTRVNKYRILDSSKTLFGFYANHTHDQATFYLGQGKYFVPSATPGPWENTATQSNAVLYDSTSNMLSMGINNIYIGKSTPEIHGCVLANCFAQTIILTDRNYSPKTPTKNIFGDERRPKSIYGKNFCSLPLLKYAPALDFENAILDHTSMYSQWLFSDCPSLKGIAEIKNVETITPNFALANINLGTRLKVIAPFVNVKNIDVDFGHGQIEIEKVYFLPEGLETIAPGFWSGYTYRMGTQKSRVKYVKIPTTVLSIGLGFFDYNVMLEIVFSPIDASCYTASGNPKAYNHCPALTRIYVPVGQKTLYEAAFPTFSPALFVEATTEEMEILSGYNAELLKKLNVAEVMQHHAKRMARKAEKKKAKEEERLKGIEEYRKQGPEFEAQYQALKKRKAI